MQSRTSSVERAIACLVGLVVLATESAAQPNVLLVIADDLGVDKVGAYGEHSDPGHTPVIDQLAAEGVLFRNAWVHPLCSSTRAAILTGRYAFRTGIGAIIAFTDTIELSTQEPSIPKLLPADYRTAAVGKWHLAASEGSDLAHPMLLGFDHHHGTINNLDYPLGEDYFSYMKNVDGVEQLTTTYATTDSVDETLGLIEQFGAEPWFIWLAFNAPHMPYHHPPDELHTFDLPDEVEASPIFMKALTEAMDTELGRLFQTMDPAILANTVILFIGDNGTHGAAIEAPDDPTHGKGTLFESGVNVPLIIKGPGVVAGAECAALVNGTDLFGTVLELAGVDDWPSEDSVSLVPYLSDPGQPSLRPWVFTEKFSPNGTPFSTTCHSAVRDERYKIRFVDNDQGLVVQQLFDLQEDPYESTNLLVGELDVEQQAAYDELVARLATLQPPPFGTGIGSVGGALAGTNGLPDLHGMGTLLPGSPVTLGLAGAVENAIGTLIMGFELASVPFRGGTLVPSPDFISWGWSTGPAGAFQFEATWPSDVPAGAQLVMQLWIEDAAGPFGYSASNGLVIVTP